jgi:Tfp pilus assembly protein FimT
VGWGRRVRARGRPAGFTLLEVILMLTLVLLLSTLVIGSLSGVLESTRIKESSSRMACLLRTARAEAANAGRRFRLSFDEETGQPAMSFEPDPLGQPGFFHTYSAWWVELAQLKGGVRAVSCELTGASAFADLEASGPALAAEETAFRPVTFYPDGTSDSARIVLARDDEEHPWAVEITLNGVDGTIQTQEIDVEEKLSE